MKMATVNGAVVRVKRRFDEEPLDALVLACKRRKRDEDTDAIDQDPFTKVLQFAGTVPSQAANVAAHLSNYKPDVKARTHVSTARLSNKVRDATKKASEENRFKVVNCCRSIEKDDAPTASKATDLPNVMIVDIEDSESKDRDSSGDGKGYVYDLYYTDMANWDDALLDQMVSVRPLPQDLVYQSGDSSDEDPDDPDSNAESNSANEYPDTEDEDDEDDRMARELGNLELSSDEADEGYLRCESADNEDIARYGQGYAKYKARLAKEDCSDTESSESD